MTACISSARLKKLAHKLEPVELAGADCQKVEVFQLRTQVLVQQGGNWAYDVRKCLASNAKALTIRDCS